MCSGAASRWRRLALCVALAASGSGCVRHLVGPARTAGDFDRKARTTAEAARSVVETALLLAETAAHGDAFGPYTSQSLSEQEDSLTEVRGDFDSIQPPDAGSDARRAELDAILERSLDHVAAVRIAARRGQLGDLDEVGRPLEADSAALAAFVGSLG